MKKRAGSTGSEEPQGNNAIVETRCDVTRNPAEKSNYFLQGAVALAVLSLALNVWLFQSFMAIKTDSTVGENCKNINPIYNTVAEYTDSKNYEDSSRSREFQDDKVNVETRDDVTRNPADKSNYFLQGAVAFAMLSLALNIWLLQSLMAIQTDMKSNQIQIECLRRDILNQEEVSKKDMKHNQIQIKSLERDILIQELGSKRANQIQMETLRSGMLNQEGILKKEYDLKPSPLYAPHVENEAKLNDLRWIRDLITKQSKTDLKDEAAKLSNWVLRLQKAENMFEINGSLKSLESQETAMNELMDEKKLETFADALYDKAKYTEALGLYEKIFKRRIVSLGPDHCDTLNAQHGVGRCLISLGERSKVLRLFRFVYQKRTQTLGPDNSATLRAQHNIALILEIEGKYADALRIYEQVLKKQESTLGENHAITKLTKSNMEKTRQKLRMK